ncbi:hypothetical protein QE109_17650, partial [Fusibacter bizertensis]
MTPSNESALKWIFEENSVDAIHFQTIRQTNLLSDEFSLENLDDACSFHDYLSISNLLSNGFSKKIQLMLSF